MAPALAQQEQSQQASPGFAAADIIGSNASQYGFVNAVPYSCKKKDQIRKPCRTPDLA